MGGGKNRNIFEIFSRKSLLEPRRMLNFTRYFPFLKRLNRAMRLRSYILTFIFAILCSSVLCAQNTHSQRVVKRYNLFFRINNDKIEEDFSTNKRAINQMREDIEATLEFDGAVPDSLLILSTASPDGSFDFNRKLAMRRAASTRKLLLEMFPEFEKATIVVKYLEEDWDGLLQVLKTNPDFPQREEMMDVINSSSNLQSKEWKLRSLKEGWKYLVNHHIYSLRNSSITISVITTEIDEFTRHANIDSLHFSYTPKFEQPERGIQVPQSPQDYKLKKTIMSAKTNLLLPGLNVGVDFPIGNHWSIGLDYYYPWMVSPKNRWCFETLAWFADVKYWFTNDETRWRPYSRLKGHAIGLYGGLGYYDYQNKKKGNQGEFIDFGVDYTYALPVANDKLRIEFNVGFGFIKTWYRPYAPSSDYEDLIKEPGVKYRTTNFISPTMAGVSLVWPITVPVRTKNPYKLTAEGTPAQEKSSKQDKPSKNNKTKNKEGK